MDPLLYSPLLAVALLLLLASGVWVAVSLIGVALIGMLLFADAPIELVMPSTMWGSVSTWTEVTRNDFPRTCVVAEGRGASPRT